MFDSITSWLGNNADWLTPLVGIGAGLIGNNQTTNAIEGAANRTLPYSAASEYGAVGFGNGVMDFALPDSPFSNLLQQIATAGAANYGATTNDPLSALDPSTRASMTAGVHQNGTAAGNAFTALGNFDMDASARDRTAMLDQYAAPNEALQRQQMEDRLFAQGRLGTTGGGIASKALMDSQNQAGLGRQLAGADFAMQKQNQLGSLATTFAGNAAGIAQNGYALAQNSRQQMFDNGTKANGTYQSLFNPLYQMAGLGIAAGGGQVDMAELLGKQATATGDMWGNAFSQLIPAAGQWAQRTWGTPQTGQP